MDNDTLVDNEGHPIHPYGEPPHRIARMARLRIKMAIDEFNLEYGSDILGYPPHICIDGENWSWVLLEMDKT